MAGCPHCGVYLAGTFVHDSFHPRRQGAKGVSVTGKSPELGATPNCQPDESKPKYFRIKQVSESIAWWEDGTICPIRCDNQLEPVEGVHLSATLDGLEPLVFGVSAYRCGNWHVFTVVPGVGLPRERKQLYHYTAHSDPWFVRSTPFL